MDHGFHSPLLDMFRRGEVPREIKMLAAHGALAPRPQEQLALLIELVEDGDLEIRLAAEETLEAIPRHALEAFLARSDAAPAWREFFATRGVTPAETAAPNSEEPLIDRGEAPAAVVETPGEPEEEAKQGATERLAAMSIAERMKAGMKGTKEERSILIRDPNKIVSAAVLSSPKVNESEIESFAKMQNVSEEVLRIIGHTRAWMKNYGIVSALARNPKTPLAVTLHLVQRLNDKDLKTISMDRNAQEPLRAIARKRLKSKDD